MKIGKGKLLLIFGIVLVVIDQVIKVLVKTNMSLGEHFNVLGDWFQILFIENEGMAFGMKFGGMWGKLALSLFRIVLCTLLCWWITKLVRRGTPRAKGEDAKREVVPTGVLVGLTLITAGAFGNIIDSLFYGLVFSESVPGQVAVFGGSYAPLLFGKVVDMFYFPLWTWPDWVPWLGGHIFFEPVFNFADSCVTVGAIYLILFQWKFFSKEDEK
ncbi:MAG: lipoprotein signal peptidase [Bacteroidales bacterium]|nr:lipoprotein signal peptidase [Bacteroidales bacterium]